MENRTNETKEVTIQDYFDYIKGVKTFNQVIKHSTGDNSTVIHSVKTY